MSVVFGEAVAHSLLKMRPHLPQARNPVHHVQREVEAVEVVHHRQVEGRGRRPLLFVAAHMQVGWFVRR